jgi:hypothetical protein
MASKEHFSMPTLGRGGEPCAACGAPLAADQRYCLNCGTRRAGLRVPNQVYAPSPKANGAEPAPAPRDRSNDVSPLGAVLGVALLGGMLLIGVLLGRGSDDSSQGTPSVVTVAGETSPTGAASPTAPESEVPAGDVVSEWPPNQDGWTVELGTLPKEDTTAADVDSAKQDLVTQGVDEVGVLDSDLYPSLPAGDYVLYSGVFDTKADAKVALKTTGATVPDALVVEVSSGATDSAGSSKKDQQQSLGSAGGDATAPVAPPESEVPPETKPDEPSSTSESGAVDPLK